MDLNANMLETTLVDLHQSLLKANDRLMRVDVQQQLSETLQNDSVPPKKHLVTTATAVVDLLDSIQRQLNENSLIVADHLFGYLSSQCLVSANQLGVADALDSSGKTLNELSQICSADPMQLQRILRILFNRGIFEYEPKTQIFKNNNRSRLLVKSHWTKWHTWIDVYCGLFSDASRAMSASLQDGSNRTPMQIMMNTSEDLYPLLQRTNWLPKVETTMAAGAVAQAPSIVAYYPWSEVADVMFLDVGGGAGGLVASLLREYPQMQASILDIEPVIQQARDNFHSIKGEYADVGDRITGENLIVGDFFISVPSYEVYTIKWTLHNWADCEAESILRNIRKSVKISSRSRLIVLEALLQDGRSGHLSQYADMIMLLAFAGGGHERNMEEWKALAKKSGWKIREVYHIPNAWVSAIEFIPAELQVGNEKSERDSCENPDTNRARVNHDAPCVVESEMRFLTPWNRAEHGNPFIRSDADEGYERTNLSWEYVEVSIRDARPRLNDFSIDKHGFAFFNDTEFVQPEIIDAIRANNEAIVKKSYYPYIQQLVIDKTGARQVFVYDHTVRRRYPEKDKHTNIDGQEQPATIVRHSFLAVIFR